jgi:hypothetical protein
VSPRIPDRACSRRAMSLSAGPNGTDEHARSTQIAPVRRLSARRLLARRGSAC